ncbi:MAG: excinuclease ABC subunit C [Bacteroidetes bacterium HGW-Bacteroidetes-20]|nr:MAG: excinuclease ABC subunit C [Bacteroidetes bacterium HGW-Bacteroidetes-20]
MIKKNPILSNILLILKTLPNKPGVYRFIDETGKIIYIGKAKDLKKRVSSYFNKNHELGKVRVLVSKIVDIQTIVVNTEWEALLLENSMIKEYRPRYNVMLKDDKTYPWIAISKEEFPRIFSTRQPDKNKQDLFGPYPSGRFMHTLLETIFEVFPIRTCKVISQHVRPCLQFHIKKCAAPCVQLISSEEYNSNIKKAIEIIKGNNSSVIKQLREEMMYYAEKWEFEKAQIIKEKIEILETFKGKSVVVNPEITNCDVFAINTEEDAAYINFLRIVEGSIIQAFTLELVKIVDLSQEDLLLMGIVEIEKRFGPLSKEIIVPFNFEIKLDNIFFTVPKRGDKKKLLELSEKNVKFFILEKRKQEELIDPNRHQKRILKTLQNDLQMDKVPDRIECFDNSNTGGDEPVAAMVCFINGKPDKREYRHFNIKSVVGPDDFASMEEVVFRRYHRVLEENTPLPDLIIIDGGKGQLSAAHKALSKLNLENKIMIIGIAKRLEDIYKVNESLPIYIDKKSESQKLLQFIRDEVHRFGITHHRKRRSKKSISSELDEISGIGPKTKEQLLVHFKSVKKIKTASLDELSNVVGKSKSKIIFQHFLINR